MSRPRLIIAPAKQKALERRHPWIFSGAVCRTEGNPSAGDIVDVCTADGAWLAVGYYQPDSIVCKVLSYDTQQVDQAFFAARIDQAVRLREMLGFFNDSSTNVFRLVNGEGDFLPGLICDYYNGVLVMQAHSMGMYRLFDLFADLFRDRLGSRLVAIFDKSSATVPNATDVSDGYIWTRSSTMPQEWEVVELDNKILINFYEGQKTGFFVDQRENRSLVRQLAQGRRVLNCFGYTGGFSLAALRGGAEYVETVDISRRAIELCERNVQINFGVQAPHKGVVADVLQYWNRPEGGHEHRLVDKDAANNRPAGGDEHRLLNDNSANKPNAAPVPMASAIGCEEMNSPEVQKQFDLVVLDPPAFAKNHRNLQQGLKGYRAVNTKAMQHIAPGGLLLTFSCSQAVSRDDFQTMAFSAAALAHRDVRIVRWLPHAMDHPVSIYHPEGEYLKGLLLQVQ
ncbi:MAG: class I SAM-dependent rRNA methyltransferase [Bacteroidales bacterium]|nr:class I SAM-dependent rRNA methyltransferase [Candidatus Colimorpha onthohippi]